MEKIEITAHWKPLEARLSPEHCAEFMWMFREHGVEYYKHILTRLYLTLTDDGSSVARRNGQFEEVDFDEEWNRVTGRNRGDLPARASH